MIKRWIACDIETYYDSALGYSLVGSHHTNESYCRDPRAELILVTWCDIHTGETGYWDPLKHSREELHRMLDPEHTAAVFFNTFFDALFLKHNADINFAQYACASVMANWGLGGWVPPWRKHYSLAQVSEHFGLGGKVEDGAALKTADGMRRKDFPQWLWAKYVEYGIGDSVLLREVFNRMRTGPCANMMEDDWIIMDWTYQNYINPIIQIDTDVLEHYVNQIGDHREKVCKLLKVKPDHMRSRDKFAEILYRRFGVVPALKKTKSGETFAFARDDEWMIKACATPGEMGALCRAKLAFASNIGPTRSQRLIDMASRGAATIGLKFCGAMQTDRFAGIDGVNWQNPPKFFGRDDKGDPLPHPIRMAIMAPDGHDIVECDKSQIEARMNATGSQQLDLIELFRTGGDPYSHFASSFYGYEVSKGMAERQVGKVCVLGLGYRLGYGGFLAYANNGNGMDFSEKESNKLVDFYRESNSAIRRNWYFLDKIPNMLQNGVESIQLGQFPMRAQWREEFDGFEFVGPTGFSIKFPEVRYEETKYGMGWTYNGRHGRRGYHGGIATENICQHLAAQSVKTDMAQMIRDGVTPRMQMHDAAAAVCRTDETIDVAKYMVNLMGRELPWWPQLPQAAEANYGPRYSDCK